jgi:glutathione S-transferase
LEMMVASFFCFFCFLSGSSALLRCSSGVAPSVRALRSLRGGGGDEKMLKFYTLDMCPYAQRCWIALLELGVPFERVPVQLRGENSDREWFERDVNPRGKVPALVDGDVVVYESLICNEYLCDKYPGGTESSSLMPTSAAARAQVRLWNEHLDSKLAPAHFTLLMSKDDADDDEKTSALEAALGVYEAKLIGDGRAYLAGQDFTLADVNALPFFERLVFSLNHFKQYDALANFPATRNWLERAMARPSFQATKRPEDALVELYQRFINADYDFGGLNKK